MEQAFTCQEEIPVLIWCSCEP